MRIWKLFRDPLLVFAIAVPLNVIYGVLVYLFGLSFKFYKKKKRWDIGFELGGFLFANFIPTITSWVLFVSLLVTPFAIYFSATNDRLAFPIRLLSTAESLIRFSWALSSSLFDFYTFGIIRFELSPEITEIFLDISLIAQIIGLFEIYFVTNMNLRKLRKAGKATRVETLLMTQMLFNSFFNFIDTIFHYSGAILINLFLGPNLALVYGMTKAFNRAFFFALMASFLNILFLRKRSEESRKETSKMVTIVTA
ncbi:unnamed protein product, partial [Mesorhabditis belari]|uniref:Uncharacterized protein n=1 Tax=Mesorhabditis belari TaxID=2138241 RepID=A0AAF3ENT9_9BILA